MPHFASSINKSIKATGTSVSVRIFEREIAKIYCLEKRKKQFRVHNVFPFAFYYVERIEYNCVEYNIAADEAEISGLVQR